MKNKSTPAIVPRGGLTALASVLLLTTLGLGLPAQLIAQSATPAELAAFGPDEDVVVRVYFSDPEVARRISISYEPRESLYELGYLVLQESRTEIERLLERSAALGIEVVIDEEATFIEQQKQFGIGLQKKDLGSALRSDSQTSAQALAFDGIPGFACYRTVEETYATAQDIVLNHPGLATWTDVGDSWERVNSLGGYALNVLRLTNLSIPGPKPTIFITSAIHAREYTTAELMTRFAEMLVADYGIDADTTWILDHTDIRLMLIANPDGRKQAETGLLWRKNTNQDYCGATSNSRGADLNRNFSYEWGCCGGSSTNQCSNTYRGLFAASEPETQAVIGELSAIFPDVRGPGVNDPAPADTSGLYLDVHSSGRLILWPWGFTSNPAPNGTALQTLGRKLAFFNGHTPQQSIGLYPTDGTTTSYGYGELGLASFTYELGTEFFESCSYFENTLLPDNIPSLKYALKVVRAPYLLPAGPEGYGIALAPSGATGVPAGTAVEVSLTFDDTRYNNSNGTEPTQAIAAAEYYLDVPPWEAGAAAVAMSAADGSFNTSVEIASATIDTSGFAEGRHTVYTRARDAAGNWGVVTAAFLDIDNNATLPTVVFEDDFESDLGWTTDPAGTDTATTGQWERADPQPTSSGGALQLGNTVSGTFALVTGPLAGTSAGTHDIDSGVTSARSPGFVIPAAATSAELSFYAYLAHLNNATSADFLRLSAVGSTSGTVVLFEELGDPNQDNANWVQSTVSLSGLAGESVYLLVEAADAAGGSLVEAALDNVVVTAVVPAGGNGAPQVDAGAAQTVSFPAAATLDGTVTDDGLPDPPASVVTAWSVVAGPGSVSFADAGAVDTTATFSVSGVYTLRLTADDGELVRSDDVVVTANGAPTADAGADQAVTLPAAAALDATVADDGLPVPPGALTTTWTTVSGPGSAAFANPGAVDTTATFPVAGTYVLRITADDGARSAADEVEVVVAPAPNTAPSVDAGADQTVLLGSDATLDATVGDDGLPSPPAAVTTAWSQVSGPGTASFADSAAVDTSASFTAPGVYVLRLTADDSVLSASDDVQIVVQEPGSCPAGSIDFGQFTLESYSNQDLSGSATPSADGTEVTLVGNAWKRSAQSFTLTPDSVIEFDYASASQGEIHGIGFDADQTLNNDARLFQFWGTQNWTGGGAIDYTPKYTGGGAFQSFSIPVGASYSGSGFRLVLVNDKDSGTPDNEGVFRCVRVVTPPPPVCSIEETFSGGAGGWTNSAASTCSTGAFVVGTPTEQVNGGVTTQVGGDHTSGSGGAWFSATNTSAGANDIDGGECIAESPVYAVASASDLSIWYFHGQRDAGDDASGDFFDLELSLDGGSTWTSLAANGDDTSNAQWTEATASVPAGSSVRLRISASDGPSAGDLVEAGVDDLRICEP